MGALSPGVECACTARSAERGRGCARASPRGFAVGVEVGFEERVTVASVCSLTEQKPATNHGTRTTDQWPSTRRVKESSVTSEIRLYRFLQFGIIQFAQVYECFVDHGIALQFFLAVGGHAGVNGLHS